MAGASLLGQLPRLSEYDPGAAGEGGLDPLGLGAVADRIADVLAPGVRARMSQPRFVTLSAVGATACQGLNGLVGADNRTTLDIVFEWLVVEAMIRYPGQDRTRGLPGSQKGQRALRKGERLSAANYLNGPRVFGFTGVYRPFSQNAAVLDRGGRPAPNAEVLLSTWEQDLRLDGFVSGAAGTNGGRFRADLAEACRRSLEQGHCAAPPTGQLMRDIAERLAPREARTRERASLRQLITGGGSEIRRELTARLLADPVPEITSQRGVAVHLLRGASSETARALQAAIDYENAATTLDNAFRRMLAYAAAQNGAVVSRDEALRTPQITEVAPSVGDLVRRAVDSLAQVDGALARDAAVGFALFDRDLDGGGLLDALIQRHDEVQSAKDKRMWLEELSGKWLVRPPYRDQSIDLDDTIWVHPMRLTTLATFLRETS